MAMLTMGATVASGVVGVLGALQKGKADAFNAQVEAENRARQADAQSEADIFNAKVARQLAESETRQGAANAKDYRRTQSARAASRRAIVSASGVSMEGSPLLVDEAIFQEIEFGAQRIAFDSMTKSSRARNAASLLERSAWHNKETARIARETGRASVENIRKASYLSALGRGLSGFLDTSKAINEMATQAALGGGGGG